MLKTKLPRRDLFLAGYTVVVYLIGETLILLQGPNRLLFLLMAPVIFAALFYPRRIYLLSCLVTFLVSLWVLVRTSEDFSISLQLLVIVACTAVVLAEVLHRIIVARAHTEVALRASEARFRSVVEHLGEGLIMTDQQDTVLYVNSRMAEIFGYTEAGMIGRPASELLLPQDAWSVARRGSGERHEMQMIGRDGQPFWAEINAMPFRDPAGTVVGTIGVLTDISERKRAQRRGTAFSALGQQLSSATTAEAAAGIIAVVADDLLGWDAFLLDLYVAEEDAIYPVMMMDVVAGRRADVSRPSIDRSPSPMARRILSEGALLLLDEVAVAEADLVLSGDTSRPPASLMFVPVRSGANTVGILSIQNYAPHAYTDEDLQTLQALADHCSGALERTRAAEKLRENEARYRAISELTSDYVFAMRVTADGQRHREWVTGAFSRITEYTIDEVEAGGGWAALVHPDDLPISERQDRAVLSGQPDVSELRIITKKGDVRWLRSYMCPEWDPSEGRVVQVLGAMQISPSASVPRRPCFTRRNLKAWGCWPAGSPMISTTCSWRSWATPGLRSSTCPRPHPPARRSPRSRSPPGAPPS